MGLNVLNALTSFLLLAILNLLFGGSIVASNIPIHVILQTSTEDAYRGRVMGLSHMLSGAITPLAVVVSGILLDFDGLPPYFLCVGGGIILFILVVGMASQQEMK